MNKTSKYKIIWFIIGLGSVIWFLIRVIPKPSRASYPCQRLAFPIASSFILWLSSLVLSIKVFIIAKRLLKGNRLVVSIILAFMAITILIVGNSDGKLMANNNWFAIQEGFTPIDEPNSPMGESFSIYPGRVVWYHNPDATSWDGNNGFFWENTHTNSNEVNKMLAESLDAVTGATSNGDSWRKLFEDFNERKHGEIRSYTAGEKIAIKINLSNSDTHGAIYDNHGMTSPQLVLALVRQLVNESGVPDSCITIFDLSQMIPDIIYEPCYAEFPHLNFIDEMGGNGREKYQTDESTELKWSQDLTLEVGGGNPTFLPKCVTEANYIINLSILKGHNMAGVTLCAKNHVGTIISLNPEQPELSSPRSAGIHPYATVHYFGYWDLPERPMGSYNTLVDLMGHKDLGNKTLLFIVDGLYASKEQNGSASIPKKWFMPPFSNDWPSSIFVSQDNVAIESVCLDFLRCEPTMENVYGNVDNYLHEAALANDPPSGMFYDPERDGTQLMSLGVHEHWNNEEAKIYTGNIINGLGIELLKLNAYKVSDLSFSMPPGEYNSSINILIESATNNIDIYYTTDGSYPNTNSILYDGEIQISTNLLINARGYRDGYEASELLSGEFLINTTSYNLDFNQLEVEIYPTISQSEITVKIDEEKFGSIILIIYNSKGEIVKKEIEHKTGSNFLHKLNIGDLSPGYYVIKIVFQDKVYTQKIIKI